MSFLCLECANSSVQSLKSLIQCNMCLPEQRILTHSIYSFISHLQHDHDITPQTFQQFNAPCLKVMSHIYNVNTRLANIIDVSECCVQRRRKMSNNCISFNILPRIITPTCNLPCVEEYSTIENYNHFQDVLNSYDLMNGPCDEGFLSKCGSFLVHLNQGACDDFDQNVYSVLYQFVYNKHLCHSRDRSLMNRTLLNDLKNNHRVTSITDVNFTIPMIHPEIEIKKSLLELHELPLNVVITNEFEYVVSEIDKWIQFVNYSVIEQRSILFSNCKTWFQIQYFIMSK